jgi:hypothetical protein
MCLNLVRGEHNSMLVRCLRVTASIGALALVLVVSARADSTADVQKNLQQIYNKRDAAREKKDIQGSLSALTPNFVFVSTDGQKGDAKLLKQKLSPLFAFMQSVKSKSDIQKLALKGKEATATVKQHLDMLVVDPQTQQPRKFSLDATSEDLWTKTPSGWLQKRLTTKTEKAMLDGKSIADQLKLNGKSTAGNSASKKKL